MGSVREEQKIESEDVGKVEDVVGGLLIDPPAATPEADTDGLKEGQTTADIPGDVLGI